MWSTTCNLAQGHEAADACTCSCGLIFHMYTIKEVVLALQKEGMCSKHTLLQHVNSLQVRARSYCKWSTLIKIQPTNDEAALLPLMLIHVNCKEDIKMTFVRSSDGFVFKLFFLFLFFFLIKAPFIFKLFSSIIISI